jgi:hypothetical protein
VKQFCLLVVIASSSLAFSQQLVDCRAAENNQWLFEHDQNTKLENEAFELFTRNYILQAQKSNSTACYVIPVVFHVYGTTQSGKPVNASVIQTALSRLNTDFHGLNSDFNSVHQLFQSSKSMMPDVTFALATLDPNGNPTSGIIFHAVAAGYGNASGYDTQIAADAWDNYKYMNIYIQNDLYNDAVLTNSGVSYYPNTSMSNAGTARIVYNGAYLSSNTSLEFSSVLTHEYGHWLNLLHTFTGGCASPNDQVADTPECDYSALNYTCHASPTGTYPLNCNNITVNAENYMDYAGAYGCYKMFSIGQVARMYAALQHPSRITLWQPSNLVAVGLASLCSTSGISSVSSSEFQMSVYPNVANDRITVLVSDVSGEKLFILSDQLGRVILRGKLDEQNKEINVGALEADVYYLSIEENGKPIANRKIIKH